MTLLMLPFVSTLHVQAHAAAAESVATVGAAVAFAAGHAAHLIATGFVVSSVNCLSLLHSQPAEGGISVGCVYPLS
jgi:hypothetical protein